LTPNLSRAAEVFLAAKASIGRSKKTTDDYRNDLNHFVEKAGDKPLHQFTNEQILDFFAFLQRPGSIPPTAGRNPPACSAEGRSPTHKPA
jgi:site-specific recombinase XerD